MMRSDWIALVTWLNKMWLKVTPHFICKEMRKKEAERLAFIEFQKEYIEKEKIVLALRGLEVCIDTINPFSPHKKHNNMHWIAWVQEVNSHQPNAWTVIHENGSYACSKDSSLEAEFRAIENFKLTLLKK